MREQARGLGAGMTSGCVHRPCQFGGAAGPGIPPALLSPGCGPGSVQALATPYATPPAVARDWGRGACFLTLGAQGWLCHPASVPQPLVPAACHAGAHHAASVLMHAQELKKTGMTAAKAKEVGS